MSLSIRSSTISRLAGVVAALWLCGAGAAWAGGGGGGADLTMLQTFLSDPAHGLCKLVGITPAACPVLPTATQGVLQLAGLGNTPPEMIGAQYGIAPGSRFTAGNPVVSLSSLPDSSTLSDLLATLTPLAFISGSSASGGTVTLTNGSTMAGNTTLSFATTKGLKTGQAYSIADSAMAIPRGTTLSSFTPTTVTMSANATSTVGSGDTITFTPIANPAAAAQLFDPNADAFLYAVAGSSSGFGPDTMYFFYDDLFRDNQTFSNGQIVAKFSFPLTVLNSGSETPVMITLQVKAICSSGAACLQANAYASGGGIGTLTNPIPASQLGIQFALVFSASPTSTQKHAIFEVAVPLLVTQLTDPAYFYAADHFGGPPGPINLLTTTAFLLEDPGTTLPSGATIGLAPTAGPLGPRPTCTGSGCTPPLSTFALCASLPNNSNLPTGAVLLPTVGAYYAIATDGETLLSAPLPGVFDTSMCPPL